MRTIGLDFETYSDVDLSKHGLDRYLDSDNFQVLLASICRYEGQNYYTDTLDFTELEPATAGNILDKWLESYYIVAHNAGFERWVLNKIGIDLPAERFIDSAVISRAVGAGEKLEAAAPQLLGIDKMESGGRLIKLFSIPGKYQEAQGGNEWNPDVKVDHPAEWTEFVNYCELDAKLSLQIEHEYHDLLTKNEDMFNALTMRMNSVGWPVDRQLVAEIQRRYLENLDRVVEEFRDHTGAKDLNLNSHKQLIQWCKDRGITARSFDEAHVASMLRRIDRKLQTLPHSDPRHADYVDVLDLLRTKQELGGSSLKKLVPLTDKTGNDGRLRDQYLHAGAGATLRTTGRGVQMQNLKRIGEVPDDVETLFDAGVEWDNNLLAKNIRQVFCSSRGDGSLIVGDFKSVESRGLAWMAGAQWKVDAYRSGLDLYVVNACKMYGLSMDAVSKEQRNLGKVGELGCGYGIGPDALKDFAATAYNLELTEGEAIRLVMDWRDVNPEVVEFWDKMQELLDYAMQGGISKKTLGLPDGLSVTIYPVNTPASLVKQMHKAGRTGVSLCLEVNLRDGTPYLRRYFRGCYRQGRNVRYYRADERKTTDLWKDGYVNPKTKQFKHYELYGGKLTGILTQSLCREIFFHCLRRVDEWVFHQGNVALIGQFHDEIVLDWWPPGPKMHNVSTLDYTKGQLEAMMSNPGQLRSFPLAADIKSDYRYTK